MVTNQSRDIPDIYMPTLADLNNISRHKSRRKPKPSHQTKESSDEFIRLMFHLAYLVHIVCYIVVAFIARALQYPHFFRVQNKIQRELGHCLTAR